MKKDRPTPRAVAVQLPGDVVRKLDELAARSGVSRHEYMILVLSRATQTQTVLAEKTTFSTDS